MAATVDSSRYSDLCRLCATKTTLVLGINIFENEGSLRQVRKKIESCLPLQIHQADDLPKMICETCLYKLDMLFDFRERSIRTEKLLQDLMKELHNEKHHQDGVLNVMAMDQTGLIMVPHHLLEGQLQNIDLTHLSQRNDIIVGHGLVLAQNHQSNALIINGHNLSNLDISQHDLNNQNLSNHSLHDQEALLMGDTNHHDLNDTQFHGGALDLIQHQQHILQEYGIRQEVEMGNLDLNDVSQAELPLLQQNEKDENSNENKKSHSRIDYSQHQRMTSAEPCNFLNSLSCDSVSRDNNIKLESLSHEDSNSTEHQLLIDERDLGEDMEKAYLLEDNSATLERMAQNSTGCVYCNLCGLGFPNEETFEEHYTTHFSKCLLCFAAFASAEILDIHMKESHGNIENQMTNGEDIELAKTRLKKTTKIIDNNIDKEEINFESTLDNSITNKIMKNNTSPVKDAVKTDQKINSQRKKWSPKVCTECGNSYKTNYKLNEHMRKHTGEKPYKCGSCEKGFRSKIGLAQHEAKHTGQYEFSCPTCGKGFQCRSYLMVHQRVHSDIKPWPCSTCGVNFKTKQALQDHTNRHLGLKPFMCDICGRGFITKGLCKTHEKIHTGLDNRKYSCRICNKMFVSKSYLQTHLRIHTGEKPFICEVCGKGFQTRVDLRIHSTLHTGEKSYICEICGKAFARRDALRCHRRSHTGERPYSCEFCGQTFTQFTPMVIHKRLHTGERPYSCEVCKKTFVSRSTMMTHAKKHVT